MVDERKETHVPVAFTGHRDDAQELDEELIALELGEPPDQVVDRAVELRARHGVEEVGMDPLHLGRELADVLGSSRLCSGLRGSGAACNPDEDHRRDGERGRSHSVAPSSVWWSTRGRPTRATVRRARCRAGEGSSGRSRSPSRMFVGSIARSSSRRASVSLRNCSRCRIKYVGRRQASDEELQEELAPLIPARPCRASRRAWPAPRS